MIGMGRQGTLQATVPGYTRVGLELAEGEGREKGRLTRLDPERGLGFGEVRHVPVLQT